LLFSGTLVIYHWLRTGSLKNKIRNDPLLENTQIPEVFFMTYDVHTLSASVDHLFSVIIRVHDIFTHALMIVVNDFVIIPLHDSVLEILIIFD
jgi:hypothetical protein